MTVRPKKLYTYKGTCKNYLCSWYTSELRNRTSHTAHKPARLCQEMLQLIMVPTKSIYNRSNLTAPKLKHNVWRGIVIKQKNENTSLVYALYGPLFLCIQQELSKTAIKTTLIKVLQHQHSGWPRETFSQRFIQINAFFRTAVWLFPLLLYKFL